MGIDLPILIDSTEEMVWRTIGIMNTQFGLAMPGAGSISTIKSFGKVGDG